jgi:hypothetical protein
MANRRLEINAGDITRLTPAASMDKLPVSEADISRAKFPATYKALKQALAKCVKVDEVMKILDWHAQLAAYAKQARDRELIKDAMRVHARAMRRLGECLQKIPKLSRQEAGRKSAQSRLGNKLPRAGREATARAAGIDRASYQQALKLAGIPEDEYEALVESADPPSINKLRKLAHEQTPPEDRRAEWRTTATRRVALRAIREFVMFAQSHLASDVAHALAPTEVSHDVDVLLLKVAKWVEEYHAAKQDLLSSPNGHRDEDRKVVASQ